MFIFLNCQTTKHPDTWCQSKCNAVGDERKNTELIEKIRENIDPNDVSFVSAILTFPIRTGIVTEAKEPIFLSSN